MAHAKSPVRSSSPRSYRSFSVITAFTSAASHDSLHERAPLENLILTKGPRPGQHAAVHSASPSI